MNKKLLPAMPAVLLIFALAACEQGTGGGSGGERIVYTSETADGKFMELTITKKAEIPSAANILASAYGAPAFAYVPQSGDLYTIKIDRVVVSSGTVTVSANKQTLTFRPESGGSFTATLAAPEGETSSDGGTLTFKDGIRTSDGAVIAVQPATTTTPPYTDDPVKIPPPTDTDGGGTTYRPPSGGGGGGTYTPTEPPAPPPPPAPPVLLGTSVSYAPDGTASAVFTFDMGVTCAAASGVTVTGSGSSVITATPEVQVAGTLATVSFTAANPEDGTKTTPVTAGIMPVTRAFSRDSDAGTCTVAYCDSYGAAALVSGGETDWVYLGTDSAAFKMFYAIYAPNSPGSTDNVPNENGRRALAYTQEISASVLGLFRVTVGATEETDGIELSGTALPTGTNAANIIVIDIGVYNEANQLPPVYIPHQGLGTDGGNYEALRIRVNRNAELVILADNSGYIAAGAGNPCLDGYFKNGTVEVMGGGKLRDGAYEGFPLGTDAAIIPRLGSYLAVGPKDTENPFFTGWLIGPQNSEARILWDGGDQSAGYMEIRAGKLALASNVTVRKTLGLVTSVWFVGGARLTVDIPAANAVGGNRGLFANGAGFRFYGVKAEGNGQITNPGNSIIEVKSGSYIDGRFFELGTSGNDVVPLYGQRTIKNKGSGGEGSAMSWTGKLGNVSGYPEWEGTGTPE